MPNIIADNIFGSAGRVFVSSLLMLLSGFYEGDDATTCGYGSAKVSEELSSLEERLSFGAGDNGVLCDQRVLRRTLMKSS